MSDVLTLPELIAYLKMTHRTAKRTILRWVREGRLKGQPVGRGDWRFMRQAVDDFLMMGGKRS